MSELHCSDGKKCDQAVCTSEFQRCRHDKDFSALRFASQQDLVELVQNLRAKLADAEAKLASEDEKDSTVRDFRKVAAGGMVKEMVDRFIGWELPEDFSPDAGITFTPTDLQKSGVHGWPTGTNLFTADQADKMIGYVAAPLLAKLLMYIHEERFNTTPQPAPDVQAAVAAALDGYKADRKDAERFRWLCEDHAGDEKKRRNILLDRMAVMTYSAICTDIDAELTGTPARTLTRAAPDLITAAADALATR